MLQFICEVLVEFNLTWNFQQIFLSFLGYLCLFYCEKGTPILPLEI